MSADKAQEIINRAMTNPSVYHAMAAQENEVWETFCRSESALKRESRMEKQP